MTVWRRQLKILCDADVQNNMHPHVISSYWQWLDSLSAVIVCVKVSFAYFCIFLGGFFTVRVSRKGNAVGCVRPSVHLFVSTHLLN